MEKDSEINVDHDMANNDTVTIFVNHKVFDYKKTLLALRE